MIVNVKEYYPAHTFLVDGCGSTEAEPPIYVFPDFEVHINPDFEDQNIILLYVGDKNVETLVWEEWDECRGEQLPTTEEIKQAMEDYHENIGG